MNDLLSRSFSGGRPRTYVDLKRDALREIEEGPLTEMSDMNSERNLALFFEEVEDIKSGMDKVKQILMKLQDANEESKTVHKAQAMKALRDRMDYDVGQVLKMAKSIKGKLEELDRANIANRRLVGCGEGSPTDRTRTSITSTLRKKLKDLMGDFQFLRQRMVGEYRETIERRYYTVTGQHPDDETIEQIIETGESENFLQKAIQEQGRGQVIETIREIQERHDAVKEIEKNLLELHQIFLDMAVLVESQGEQLNTIEEQVNRASSFVMTGTTHLHTAKAHQRSSRKWMCIGIVLLLILIIIIVVPIVTSLKRKSTN
ncbi:hypothetical protein O6H91_09G075200 [Diphasiastrum complanatum]|uniref:Uncharacterized protein n=1 Tax=Diphasiastrum complanatum TaxID=34168 RepID=A0ACC2CR14_DIPCM|nr:hypothetical protein O6H91_Y157500 [Diphasiastrum complanatum]KAJ7544358.1 hypothetical protein O6H91_09G075200 [Diphasiastrum complanatum]